MLSKLFNLLLALGLMTTVAACGPGEDAEEGTMEEGAPTEEVEPAEGAPAN